MDNKQINSAATSNNRIITIALVVIIGFFLACILIPVVIIAILSLLGPSIGNVFSSVITSLPPTP
jgi:hypothetical protein